MKSKLLISIAAITIFFIGCTSSQLSKKEQIEYSKMSDKSIHESALSQFNQRNYKRAINIYAQILKKKNPEIKYAAWAQYEIGFCYYYLENFQQALIEFKKVVKNYPQKIAKAPRILAAKLIKKIEAKKTDGI